MSSLRILLPFAAVALPLFARQPPDDPRHAPPKDLDGDFAWTPPASPAAWVERSAVVKRQMQVALGLWPEPTRTPLNAVIHGRIDRGDFSVERVFFEAIPGYFVTGSLFRPASADGRKPAILCPHGHWNDGRFHRKTTAELSKEIERGEERFERGGVSMFQSLGAQFARMGCIAFVIDMAGYADSQQLSFDLVHRFRKQRPEMISSEAGRWGFFSPQAESHLQSVMGLQTWSTLRAVDFLVSLPDVDPERIACTGASGGGTQTMILGALDERIAVAAPAVMVSTAMQGGCTCENACLLRVDTGNIEFAALFAPRPMALTSAKDWTIEMPAKGFPELQRHWSAMRARDRIVLFHHPEFGHNYNIVSREHIYAFFNRHLALNLPDDRLRERDYEPLSREELTVWNAAHPAPPSGDAFERRLLEWWTNNVREQLEKDIPTFKKIALPALESIIGTSPGSLPAIQTSTLEKGSGHRRLQLQNSVTGECTALTVHGPMKPRGRAVVWLSPGGAAGLLKNGTLHPAAARLAANGFDVIGIDLFRQDEPGAKNRPVKNPREAPAYTYGYNRSLLAQRVRDVILAIDYLRRQEVQEISLVALDSSLAPIAAIASALSRDAIDSLTLDTGGFRFLSVADYLDPQFLPGATRYGDLPGIIALNAPRKLHLAGEGSTGPGIVTAAYESAAVADTLRVSESLDPAAAAEWLIDRSTRR
jgi:dienelactone hydrolase